MVFPLFRRSALSCRNLFGLRTLGLRDDLPRQRDDAVHKKSRALLMASGR